MGGGEILEVLGKDPNKWLCIHDLNPQLSQNQNNISAALRRLRKSKFIDYCKVRNPKDGRMLYFHKLGTGVDHGDFEKLK